MFEKKPLLASSRSVYQNPDRISLQIIYSQKKKLSRRTTRLSHFCATAIHRLSLVVITMFFGSERYSAKDFARFSRTNRHEVAHSIISVMVTIAGR
jgi:hypothetical protein